ncbi:hypothetical protein BD410DRAFT_811410 [Rickenella mellea]|uniref:Methyltransferase domain-containing protein n=1 Tax=Rickenella mellea TaxID=50990 RepID=A0A4R5XFS9_9AGAM|nr:hypothetical protein BD410DRAFT_811410 [Rickenella mellea]
MDFNNDIHDDLEPEYDMEFNTTFGPNPMELPLSPPISPPPPGHPNYREASPFSTNTSMTSLDSTGSEGFYREESGRMYSALPGVPVVLPVDHAEIRRVSEQHELMKILCGEDTLALMRGVLDPQATRTLRVLDVISNSPWVDEMAEEYPYVKFHGCNFVPTRHPFHDNVQFEVYNLNDGFRGQDASYDIIHAANTFKMTRNFKEWLSEFKRLLRPNGLLIIRDLEIGSWMADGSDRDQFIPALMEHINCVKVSVLSQGIDLDMLPLIGSWLRDLDGFDDVDDTVTSIPVGDWETEVLQKEIGTMARDNIMSVLYSVHPLHRRIGKSAEEIEQLMQSARFELYDKGLRLFERMFCVVARRASNDAGET